MNRRTGLVVKTTLVGAAVAAGAFTVAYAAAQSDDDAVAPATTVVPYPEHTNEAQPLSLEGHPQDDFLRADPDGEQVRAMYETGWTPVFTAADGSVHFAQLRQVTSSTPGELLQVVDASGEVVAYWIVPGLYVPREVFETDSFDWQNYVRTESPYADAGSEEFIATIEAAGGLRTDPKPLDP
jgi:hypothetical protein